LNFLDKFSGNIQISYFIKIYQGATDLLHADGQTDRQTDITKLTVIFRNLANAPKNGHIFRSILTSYIPAFTNIQTRSTAHVAFY